MVWLSWTAKNLNIIRVTDLLSLFLCWVLIGIVSVSLYHSNAKIYVVGPSRHGPLICETGLPTLPIGMHCFFSFIYCCKQMDGLTLTGLVGIMRVMNTGEELSLKVGNVDVLSIKLVLTPSTGATVTQTIGNGENEVKTCFYYISIPFTMCLYGGVLLF